MDKGHTIDKSQLGKSTEYLDKYTPSLLYAISRDEARTTIKIDSTDLPFNGVDIWTAYEVSWLNEKGKPEVAIGEFCFPVESKNLVESKSLKLYLNSFNQTRFDSVEQVRKTIEKDLSNSSMGDVQVSLNQSLNDSVVFNSRDIVCLDSLDIDTPAYLPDRKILEVCADDVVAEQLVTHLFRSLCPVTGQPDWASVIIDYTGIKIEHASLLRYLVSFRQHQGFHEHCVEQLFTDIFSECCPEKLTIQANFLRRGGLDISPIRSTEPIIEPFPRHIRQ